MSSIAVIFCPILFGLALFLSSALLFLVQPMVARTLLPHLGGNPLAWNACLVFFQSTLLAGYLYANVAHWIRGKRWQACLHLVLLFGAAALVLIGLFGDWMLAALAARLTTLDTYPVLTTFAILSIVIGVVLRPRGNRALRATLVQPSGSSEGSGPVFSLRRQQPGWLRQRCAIHYSWKLLAALPSGGSGSCRCRVGSSRLRRSLTARLSPQNASWSLR